ncbi:MAG: hypothetical protein L7U58_10480, partial [Planktomarina sp.]|nr:hypothetical protein [Planktomarina sp.]
MTPVVLVTAYMLLEILTLILAHHSFAQKGIHALIRVIAVIGKILLSDGLNAKPLLSACKQNNKMDL